MAALSTNQTRTLILGGGIGGIATANRLHRKAPSNHEIVLVDRNPVFSLAASYLWVMNGQRRPAQISRPLNRLKRRGVDVRIGDIDHIDTADRSATIGGETLSADNVVISLGAQWTTDMAPGLSEHGHTFATLGGAQQLATKLRDLNTGRVLVVTAAPLYKCPAAPYEAALLIDALARKRGAPVEVAIHAAEPAPMGVAGPNVSKAVRTILAGRNITYQPSHQITGVEAGAATFSDGDTQEFDLLVYMPGIRPPDVLAATGLADITGWIDADPNTLATDAANVYAIGDNTQIPLSIGKPLPRAGVFAHGQATTVADNIAAALHGREGTSRFDGHGGCFIETGNGRAGYGSGDFYAQPAPEIGIRPPARRWHLGKAMFEQNVLRRWL